MPQMKFELPWIGAKILEGLANGFDLTDMRWAFSQIPLPLCLVKEYAKNTCQALYVAPRPDGEGGRYKIPLHRAIGMSTVANLLRYKDLQQPGEFFAFTMKPSADCPIQYLDSYDPRNPRAYQNSRPLPDAPVHPMKVPAHEPLHKHAVMLVDGQTRSFLAGTLLGMSSAQINAQGISSLSRHRVEHQKRYAGFRTVIQFAAHCAANDVVQAPPAILDPAATPEPIRYEQPAALLLPAGVVASKVCF